MAIRNAGCRVKLDFVIRITPKLSLVFLESN